MKQVPEEYSQTVLLEVLPWQRSWRFLLLSSALDPWKNFIGHKNSYLIVSDFKPSRLFLLPRFSVICEDTLRQAKTPYDQTPKSSSEFKKISERVIPRPLKRLDFLKIFKTCRIYLWVDCSEPEFESIQGQNRAYFLLVFTISNKWLNILRLKNQGSA